MGPQQTMHLLRARRRGRRRAATGSRPRYHESVTESTTSNEEKATIPIREAWTAKPNKKLAPLRSRLQQQQQQQQQQQSACALSDYKPRRPIRLDIDTIQKQRSAWTHDNRATGSSVYRRMFLLRLYKNILPAFSY